MQLRKLINRHDADDHASVHSMSTLSKDLLSSRPYKRLVTNRNRRRLENSNYAESVFSVDTKSSTKGGQTWSMLSDMSLGALSISQIAVLELPICYSDLPDPALFQEALKETKTPVEIQGQAPSFRKFNMGSFGLKALGRRAVRSNNPFLQNLGAHMQGKSVPQSQNPIPDPVSIAASLSTAASVVGLLPITVKIAGKARELYKSAKDAPKSLRHIQEEMDHLGGIFRQARLLLGGKSQPNISSLNMIYLHQLLTTLSGCVVLCTKLNAKLDEVSGPRKKTVSKCGQEKSEVIKEHVNWILWGDAAPEEIIEDLQRHRGGLRLMLDIIYWYVAVHSNSLLLCTCFCYSIITASLFGFDQDRFWSTLLIPVISLWLRSDSIGSLTN